jgi:hypothetical protein
MKQLALVVATAAWALGTAVGQAREQPPSGPAVVDVERVGPQVGEAIPDFTLPDQTGRARSMKSLLGPQGGVLVFFRSADW